MWTGSWTITILKQPGNIVALSFVQKVWTSVLLISAVCNIGVSQSMLDVAPSGRPNERAVQGGSRPVALETNVPLQMLIQRLKGNWNLVETYKGYWIGYTDDMYSIARHGEQAIGPLVEFIRSTSSDHARYGALLTLHLVGIESRVAGRFHEEFRSKRVREVFYGLLEDSRLRDEVLLLLVRDPWPSDISHMMKLLAREGDVDCRPTVNGLFRYALKCPAFGGTLANDVSSARVFVVEGKRTTEVGQLFVFTEEQPNEGVERINQLNSTDKDIVIQLRQNGGRKVWKFTDPAAARRTFAAHFRGRDICEVTYDALREHDFVFRYCELSDPFNFHVSGTNAYILDPSAAKARWLEWWGRQPDDYKNALKSTQDGPAKGSRPIRSETNSTSSAARSRRWPLR
jgi:hypothetical protein